MTTPPSVPTPRPHEPQEPQEPPTGWVAGIPAQRTAADAAAARLTAPSARSAAGSGGAAPGPWPVAAAGGEVPPAAPPGQREASGRARAPKVRRWPWAGAGLVVGLAVGAGIGAGGAVTTTSAAAAPATVTVTAPAAAPRTVTVTAPAAAPRTVTVTAPAPAPRTVTVTAAPTTEAAPAAASSVSDGVYEAGVDIRAGRYKTSGGGTYGTCIWRTSRDGTSGFEAFVDGGSSSGQMYASVESGQFLELTGGCTWTKVG